MQIISKDEARAVRLLGFNDYVKSTYTKHKTYFIVEDKKALKALEEYRESKIITA